MDNDLKYLKHDGDYNNNNSTNNRFTISTQQTTVTYKHFYPTKHTEVAQVVSSF